MGGIKMKKRIVSALSAVTMLVAGGITLSACNEKTESKVMNVSLNPKVEFVLDNNDKVVSVNALNEEGNIIISSDVEFVGVDADTAVKLFVEVSKDTGYLVSGNVQAGDNNIDVSISGDKKNAEKLFKSIKDEINGAFANLNIAINQAEALTEEYLEKLVKECYPYLEEAEIKAMEYDELIKEIQTSRKETAKLFSQELKNAYYQAKADALRLAKLEKIKSEADALGKVALGSLETAYNTAVELIETTRQNLLLSEDSAYQKALKAFNEAKTNYLNKRSEIAQMDPSAVTDEMRAELENLDALVETCEQALSDAYTAANNALDTAKAQLTTAYNAIVEAVNNMGKSMDIASENMTDAVNTFANDFETNYKDMKDRAKERVDQMRGNLTNHKK